MTTYTYAQLEELWTLEGGPKALAPIMAAIALAESSGDSNAYNASGASGLWQILGAVHGADQAHLFNPYVNAKEAVLKYQTQGLGAWVTYTSGAYKKYLKGGVPPATTIPAADASASSGGTSGGGGGGGGGLWPSQVTGFFSGLDHAAGDVWGAAAGLFSPTPWIRAGAGLLAAVLLALGLVALARAAM